MKLVNRTTIVLLLFLFPHIIYAESHRKEETKYVGQWWLSVSPEEQDGFISGYYDCYTNEYRGSDQYTAKSFSEYEKLITNVYMEDASKQNLFVSEVLHSFRDRFGEKRAAGDAYPRASRGNFDGLYWRQISVLGGETKQIGFVEGYLWCHSHLARNKGGIFSKAPAEYVALITRWYGFVEKTGDIDAEREPTKVADVLFKFRDHPQGPRSGSR